MLVASIMTNSNTNMFNLLNISNHNNLLMMTMILLEVFLIISQLNLQPLKFWTMPIWVQQVGLFHEFFIMNNFDFHMNFTIFFLQLPTIKTTSLILVTMGSGIPWNGIELLKNLHGNVSLVLMDLWSFWSMCFG